MDKPSQKSSGDERVAIVIPVYNHLDMTRGCLETLFADAERPAYEVVVVDNASRDGTAEYLAAWPDRARAFGRGDSLTVIANRENLGVAPAWNQGVRATRAPWVAILNNDIRLAGLVARIAEAIESRGLALGSPFPLEGPLPADLDGWARGFTARNRRKIWNDYSFVAFALRRATLESIGEFDENFRVGGYEDTDYIYRLRAAGLRYGIVGASALYHYGSQTLKEFKERGDAHAAANKRYFMEKWKVDPSLEQTTPAAKWSRRVRRWKLRFGFM